MGSCHYLNDDRIPMMPVNIDLSNPGVWASWGVFDYGGDYREFILSEGKPAGFPYIYNSATGFGGVLLIGGQNPFTGETGPLAYDLSCPVERQRDIRVHIIANMDAVCDVCGSHYNVVEANGTPVSGPAKDMGYAMTSYNCYPTVYGGYIISGY